MGVVNAFGALALDQTIADVQGTGIPKENDKAFRVRGVSSVNNRVSFAKVLTNSVDSDWGTIVKTGSGMTVNQTGGNLVLTTGTTANSETIIRSNTLLKSGGHRVRWKMILSQRIANQTFEVALTDVIGDGLAATISSATAISVTIPAHGFTAQNIGQGMDAGAYTGTGTFPPQRLVIASITDVNTVVFTGAGMAAGSGTISLFGYNYYKTVYTGTTATNATWDTARKGWATGATTQTINTTASPGHIAVSIGNDGMASFYDMTPTSIYTGAARGVKMENVPDDIDNLRLQIRVFNGTSAPASTTTMTMGFIVAENFSALDTVIQDTKFTSSQAPVEASIQNTPAVTISSGTVTTVSTVSAMTPAAPTAYSVESTAAALAAAIKATAGTLYEITVSNITATACYVKIYNKATAPTPASDTPIFTVLAPANTLVTFNFGPMGKRFATGIAIGATAAAAKTDTTVLAAGVQISATYI